MKLRNAGVLVAVLAALVSCDRGKDRGKPAVAPVTQGGSSDPWSASEPAKQPLEKPLFWKLEKDGNTSYLLGTMHVGIDPHARLPQIVWDKLDESKTFASEADVAKAGALDVTRKDGTTLRDELGEEYWKKLEAAIGAGAAQQMLNVKPMIPATMLAMRGLPNTPSMDGVLHGRAVNQKKNIVFLEPIELQVELLEKWMNARALKDLLDDLPGSEARAKDLLAAYVSGDSAAILAVHDRERELWLEKGRPAREYEEQMEDLLYKRNAAWIAPIEKLHAEGGGFIAVGAAHVVGPRGVLDLLEKKGFAVTRVTP